MTTIVNHPVGTRVVSYDFPGNRDCYIVGEVAEVNADQYTILVEKQVVDAVVTGRMIGKMVFPPLNGLQGLFGVTNGVQACPAV